MFSEMFSVDVDGRLSTQSLDVEVADKGRA